MGRVMVRIGFVALGAVFGWGVEAGAAATIEGASVVVRAAAVPAPVAVRYAWASNPAGANLYNREGLPANPFRTDTWPVVTQPSAAK